MELPASAHPQTPTPRAAILACLEARRGKRIRASEILREGVPGIDDLSQLVNFLRTLDQEDLINVDFEADADGVERTTDPACWLD